MAENMLRRVASAVFYAITSIACTLCNKVLLTNYRFPSFEMVALGQVVATIVILRLAKALRIIKFLSLDSSIPRKIFPLPILYGINVVAGLGGTKMLSLPMFTVLRRFSILVTMFLEFYVLGVVASSSVRLSVTFMIVGSILAAVYDLSFDSTGYLLCSINNLCTAALGICTKQKLDAKDLGKYGLMYYNCLIMATPLTLLCYWTGDIEKAIQFMSSEEMSSGAWLCFMASGVCGFILNYSLVLCTYYNSALTTQCVGAIKNVLVTYVGMITSDDFLFGWLNLVGINISVAGSILYSYVTFVSKTRRNSASSAKFTV